MEKQFNALAQKVDDLVGSPKWLAFSFLLVILWFPSGFIIGFNDTWQLIINTSTTILTFLMMALLHASESRWEKRMQNMELKQERILKIVELQTQRILNDLEPELHNETLKSNPKPTMSGKQLEPLKTVTTPENISSLH